MIDLEKEEDDAPNIGTMKVVEEFDQVMVWGHENVACTGDDAYVRNLEEWIQVSDRVWHFDPPNLQRIETNLASDSFVFIGRS